MGNAALALQKQAIYWKPTTSPNVVAYEILYSDTGIAGPYARRDLVLSDIPSKNWDDEKGVHFYLDDEVPYRYYRLRVYDRYGNIAEDDAPTPFQANNNAVQAPKLHYVALGVDNSDPDKYKYVTPGGNPIRGATVRVYRKIDWVTHQLDKVVGTTETDPFGKIPPIFVEPGETYTLVYHKPYEYGPDTMEVTV